MAFDSYSSAPTSSGRAVSTAVSQTRREIQSVTLSVAGQRITIKTDQDIDYLKQLAAEVTALVDGLRRAAPGSGLPQLMALAALQLADRANSAEAAIEQRDIQVENHIAQLTKMLSLLDNEQNL